MNQKQNNESRSHLNLIIAEAELECIPSSIQHHPQIKSFAKKRKKPASQLLLDASHHHAAMNKLFENSRRGRPDIVHRCALLALDSWANSQDLLRCYIHTRHDYVIEIHPSTRLPRQYHRFVGLIEQLMKKTEIRTDEHTLLSYKKKSLKELVHNIQGEKILFWEQGKNMTIGDLFASKKQNPLTIIIGGFPHGDFHQPPQLIEQKICVEKETFTASYLTAKSIISFEQNYYHHL